MSSDDLRRELAALLGRYGIGAQLETSDDTVAGHLMSCLNALEQTLIARKAAQGQSASSATQP